MTDRTISESAGMILLHCLCWPIYSCCLYELEV